MRRMNRRTLLTLIALTATLGPVATSAQAATWSTGAYRGKVTGISRGEPRGSATLRVTRTNATLGRLTVVLRCARGPKRTFTIDDAGSSRLRRGSLGASAMFRGKRTIDGYIVEWDLVGGVKQSTFRTTVDIVASATDDPNYPACTLSGSLVARRR